jgi:hypothetical protein
MRNSLKLGELELVIGTDVDECTLVLSHVAVLGGRKD